MLYPPGFYFVKKPKRFVILSSERNLSCFFDIIKPRRVEHLHSDEPFSSDPYFRAKIRWYKPRNCWLFKFWQTMFRCSFWVFLILLLLYYICWRKQIILAHRIGPIQNGWNQKLILFKFDSHGMAILEGFLNNMFWPR